MPRFFILSINYAPEPTGFSQHASALAEHLARKGHDVTVYTGFPFAPAWRRSEDYRGVITATEHTGGVTVRRLTHFIPRRPSSTIERALMEGSFSAMAFCAMAAADCGFVLSFINSVRNYECFRQAVSKNVDAPDFNPFIELPEAHIDVDGLRRMAAANGVDDFGFPAYRDDTIAEICQDYLVGAEEVHRSVRKVAPSVLIAGLTNCAILTGAAASAAVNRVRSHVANSNVRPVAV